MKFARTPEEQRTWMAQWRSAATALQEIKAAELQAMTDEETARIVTDVLPEVDYRSRDHDKDSLALSGLIEQQRLFALLRQTS